MSNEPSKPRPITLDELRSAVEDYSRSIPDTAVTKITFNQEPADRGWKVSARLLCFGELLPKEPDNIQRGILENVDPKLVHDESWEAEEATLDAAMERLRQHMAGAFETRMWQLTSQHTAVESAVRGIKRKVEGIDATTLTGLWATEDPDPEEVNRRRAEEANRPVGPTVTS